MTEGLRYRTLLPLGHGGMAEVFLAYGQGPGGFGKLVVLKSMRKQLAVEPDMREMFLAEARLHARLNHSNVVHVYEVLDTTVPSIVMEYLEGQPLSRLIDTGGAQFPLHMHLRILSEVLAGLHYSHEFKDYDGTPLQIVHRDISPQNIFITYDGSVKVLDFGIAKIVSSPIVTKTGIVKGKLPYMPREQLLNETVDRRADIYSMGCLLWEAVAGGRLWGEQSEGTIMRRLIAGNLPSPTSRRPVDEDLLAIVRRAMAPSARDRYATAREFQQDIDLYLEKQGHTTALRAVGEYVETLFSAERAELGRTVRAALQSLAQSDESTEVRPLTEPPHAEALPVQPSVALSRTTRFFRRPAPVSLLSIGLLLVMGTGSLWYLFHRVWPPTSPTAITAPAASVVRVSFTTSPADAVLYLDGAEVPRGRRSLEHSADKARHHLLVTAPGYLPHEQDIGLDRDMHIEVALSMRPPLPDPAAASAVSAQPEPTRPATKSHGRSFRRNKAPLSCNPPYYFDQGLKVFKPHCI